MADTVTETTTESWGSRLGGSLKGVLIGFAMFVAAFPLLFWNEGNSVKTAKALDEGENACIPVESVLKVDPELEGQLIHATALADTKDTLSDADFGITSTNTIALKRSVEMYQWEETSHTEEKKNVGGSVTKTTTYSYSQEWSSRPIDSSRFHDPGHQNPGAFEFKSWEKRAKDVTFGAFHLNESQIARIGSLQAYAFPTDWVCRVSRTQRAGDTIYVPNLETRANPLNNRDVASTPRVGDMRVRIEVIQPHVISIVAKQKGDTFGSYLAKTKKKVDLLQDGSVEMAEMFEDARDANALMTWILRLVGFLLMYFGLAKVLKPLSVLGDVLPVLGDLLEVGTGIAAGIIAFVCAITTIGVSWLFYRPILGIVLLALAAGGVFLLWKKRAAIRGRGTPAASPVSTTAAVLAFLALSLSFTSLAAQCQGTTKTGAQCKREAAEGSQYCIGHADQAKTPKAEKLKDDGTCWAVTEKGTRCKHKKDGESDYCKQHAADKKPAKPAKQCRALNWNGKQCERAPKPDCYYCAQHARLGALPGKGAQDIK